MTFKKERVKRIFCKLIIWGLYAVHAYKAAVAVGSDSTIVADAFLKDVPFHCRDKNKKTLKQESLAVWGF